MTKRDFVCAGIDPPRVSTSMQHRQFALQWQSRSGAASSDNASSSGNAMGNWPQDPNRIIPLDQTPVVRRPILIILGTRQRSLRSLCHMDLIHTPKGKHIRYKLKSNNGIECFTPTFSRRYCRLPRQSPYGDGSRSMGSTTEPPAGIFLPWHCWSCETGQLWKHRQLGSSNPTGQLLASLLQHP